MQTFPPTPGGPDTHLLFTSIYIHIPRMAAGWGGVGTGCFDCEKDCSSKRIKGSSFMHLGNEEAGWVTAAAASMASAMEKAGMCISPLLSPCLGRLAGNWSGWWEGGLEVTVRWHLGRRVPPSFPLWLATRYFALRSPLRTSIHTVLPPARQLCHGRIASPHLSCYATWN